MSVRGLGGRRAVRTLNHCMLGATGPEINIGAACSLRATFLGRDALQNNPRLAIAELYALRYIAIEVSGNVHSMCFHAVGGFLQTVYLEEKAMRRTAIRSPKVQNPQINWRDAERAARRFNAADSCDDRVSEEIFDVEDERAEVANIVRRIFNDLN